MEFLFDPNSIRIADGSVIKVRNSSVLAVYATIALAHVAEDAVMLSAFDISRKLRGVLSPATISKIIWEEKELERREGILFEIHLSESPSKDTIKKGQKPETGQSSASLQYSIAEHNIRNSPSILCQWLNNFIARRLREGHENITWSRASDLDRLQAYITEGNFKKANLLYGAHELKLIGKYVSGTARQRLLVKRDRIYGGMLMSQGNVKASIHILRQAVNRGKQIGEIYEVAQAAGNLAAALRMVGIREISIARQVCLDAIEYVRNARQSLNEADYGSLLRWLHTTLSCDFNIYEDFDTAFASTEEALDCIDLAGKERYTGETETRFRRAQIHLHKSDIDKSEQELQNIERLVVLPEVASIDWIGKWLPRLRADIFMSQGKSEEAINALLQGWHMNSHYGFQRVHIAQRLLNLDYVDSSMTRGIEILHKRFLGTYSSDCKYCRGLALNDRLRCVIDRTWPAVPPSFWF